MDRTNLIKTLTVSAIVFIAVLLTALVINIVKLSTLNSKKEALTQRLSTVESQIKENDEIIEYISTDEYIDRYAREYLNMTGADEEAFTGK